MTIDPGFLVALLIATAAYTFGYWWGGGFRR